MRSNIVFIGLVVVMGGLTKPSGAVDFQHTAPKQTTLSELEAFHGHLGPYVVIGARIGDMAIRRLKAKRYGGLHVWVESTDKPPQRCAIDGLQVATGATYGKANIEFIPSPQFRVRLLNGETHRGLNVRLTPAFAKELAEWFAAKVDLKEQTHRVAAKPLEEMIQVEEFSGQ
jgi:formylmethanofuran dehydrogenase subunit E